VSDLEKIINRAQGEMTLASSLSDGEAIQRASQELARAQKLLKEKYAEWEKALQKLSELETLYEDASEES